ncbi:MAG: polysaccharide biosynthesis protein, partial [Lentisphaeria bacterium]|nr:polysaccharide biosynthesis protein [Lentisphaeria bacterium]
MDGRHYTLSCKVNDIAAHKKIIQRSNICVMYIALTTGMPDAVKTMNLAVAITSGTMRDIFIGRTGVFIGKDGTEWDAKVVDFVQQPVSLGEAIQMPFIRFGEFLEKQADRFFSSKSKTMETSVASDLSKGNVPGEILQTAQKQTPAVSGSMMLMLLGYYDTILVTINDAIDALLAFDMGEIFTFLQDKTILVTGGGGSIGSELCRQISEHNPRKLIIFD